jgi:putative ABC transport system substrate-binding protein
MRRREFIAVLGSASLCPVGVLAQPTGRTRRIGLLSSAPENDPLSKRIIGAFVQELQRLGWVEGQDFRIDIRRGASGVVTQDLADALVSLQPDVLIGSSTVGLRVLQKATRTIPTVFIGVSDPVTDGFVASFAKPGGNITGFSSTEPKMTSKWYELLKATAPQVKRVLILFNPNTAPHSLYLEPLKAEAPSFGFEAVPAPVQTNAEIDGALSRAGDSKEWGMVAMPDSYLCGFIASRSQI